MGNDESSMVDDSIAPSRLSSRSLSGLAEYIKSGKCKKIVVMTGAGISTSAGIPDFRSPETGLYANLARLNLPYAEAVFDIGYFRGNPVPFYTLAHELYPGKYKPTITHSFIKLLHTRALLLKHFTQNIDCLDREAGVPGTHIIEAHGSFAKQSCIECKEPYPPSLMDEAVQKKEPPNCMTCGGLVKPDIVFFGEALPPAFFEARGVPFQADLAIIMGTSLTVAPFSQLPVMIPEGVPRVLINKEPAGGIGSRPDDVVLLGDCDEQVRALAEACGWLEELDTLWKSVGGKIEEKKEAEEEPRKDENAEDEVEKLTKELDKTLSVSAEHEKRTRDELAKEVRDHVAGETEGKDSEGPRAVRGATDAKSASKDSLKHDSGRGDGSLSHVYSHIKSNLS